MCVDYWFSNTKFQNCENLPTEAEAELDFLEKQSRTNGLCEVSAPKPKHDLSLFPKL